MKTPAVEGGFHSATTDPDQIRRWWSTTPRANVGCAVGAAGLFVVDLDSKHDGPATWERIAADRGFTPNGVLAVNTPSGGRHLYYRQPPTRLGNSQSKIAPGIDTRGDGGYVLLPPSIVNGKAYTWADLDHTPGELPAAVIELLTHEPELTDPWASKRLTLAEIRQPRPAVDWVLDGVMARRSLTLLYGAPGSLKSMIAGELAACVAGGHAFLASPDGHGGQAVRQGPVVWLDLDSGEDVTVERLAAFAAAHNLPYNAPLTAYCSPSPTFNAANPAAVAWMIARCQGAALVVIDTLTHVKGDIDSNSDDMTQVMAGLRAVAERTGAAVLVLHHQRKTQTGSLAREGDSIRGSSAIEAGLDAALLVLRDERRVTIKATKARRSDIPAMHAEFAFEQGPDDKTLTLARFWPTTSPTDRKQVEQEARIEADILALLSDQAKPMSKATIEEGVTGRREMIRQCLINLRQRGELTMTAGPRGANLYAIRGGQK